jgi:hypothetical protein
MDSVLVADFWSAKNHLFERENIYGVLFFSLIIEVKRMMSHGDIPLGNGEDA